MLVPATLPGGTVTFVFTDIEGSTPLLTRLGDGYLPVLEQHRRIIRAAVAGHAGVEVKTEGDGFFLAFADPVAAVAACVDAQIALAAARWPADHEVRVRMGLHSGMAAQTSDGDYHGLAVNKAARLMAAAHGGQILLSEQTATSLKDLLPRSISLVERGRFRLAGFNEPEGIVQLIHPALEVSFPPLRASPVLSNNLPDPRTSLIGRGDDVKLVGDMLANCRLVTVVGPGGAGKTRLALEIGARFATQFTGGVVICDLSTINEPKLVPSAIADSVGVRAMPGVDVFDLIAQTITGLDVLIIVDNCEHMVEPAAAAIEDLLDAATGLRVLATSRERLEVPGESVYRVALLDVPEPGADLDTALQSAAIRLFEDRARLIRAEFAVTADNVTVITDLCRILEGLPLAIELVAARVDALPLSEIAERLVAGIDILTGSSRRPSRGRHSTLEATIDWGYQLLNQEERHLLRTLSVFASGFSFDAAVAVGGGDDPANTLARLVTKSMVVWDPYAERYRLLETVRRFASRRCAEAAEILEAEGNHAAYYADLVASVESELVGPNQARWLETLHADHDNIRRAIAHLTVQPAGVERAMGMLPGLSRYVVIRADMSQWISLAEALVDGDVARVRPVILGRALAAASFVAGYVDADKSTAWSASAVQIAELTGDRALLADHSWLVAALSYLRGEPSELLGERAVALAEQSGNLVYLGQAKFAHAGTVMHRDPVLAASLFDEAIALTQRTGDLFCRYMATSNRGLVTQALGKLEEARRYVASAVAMADTLGYNDPLSRALLGELLVHLGELDEARHVLLSALQLPQNSPYQMRDTILRIAYYAVAVNAWRQAAHLYGYAGAVARKSGHALDHNDNLDKRTLGVRARIMAALGDDSQRALEEGACTSWVEVHAIASKVLSEHPL